MWVALLSLAMTVYALYLNKWSEAVSSLAVTAAVISAILAYEVIYNAQINQLPQIIVKVDGESRYSILQLVIQNIGGSAAYNVRLKWLEEYGEDATKYLKPKLTYGGDVRIHSDQNFDRIISLQKGESHFLVIDGYWQFFENNKSPANYIALVKYTDQFKGGNEYEIIIPISMEEFRLTLDYAKESTRADYAITQMPDRIDKIARILNNIADSLNNRS